MIDVLRDFRFAQEAQESDLKAEEEQVEEKGEKQGTFLCVQQ